MSWGIAETASEIEKIKSESADYLNGLNSCGVIDWNTYNYAFDFYADLLMNAYEQGRKDAQPEPCGDAVSRAKLQERLQWIIEHGLRSSDGKHSLSAECVLEYVNEMPSAQPEPQWIPIKWHNCTDEEREKYGFSNDIVAVFDCEMPYDDQPILVTTYHGYVNQDVCYIDDGYSLDSGWDWIDDIKAWIPLPEPYAERREE